MTTQQSDRVWVDSMATAYDAWLVPTVFRPFARDLVARAEPRLRSARRVLDLAAGTGVLTSQLISATGGDVVAADLNDAMVEVGRHNVPGATWRQADAAALPFDNDEFDVVACQFGVMFLPDKPACFAEVRRVLAPNGVFVFNVWATVEQHAFAAAVVAALGALFPEDAPRFLAAVPHGYCATATIESDVCAGGFDSVDVENVVITGKGDAGDVAAGFCLGTPVRGEIQARGDLAATVSAVRAEAVRRLGPGVVGGDMAALVIVAS
jgi:ubiquinone/menaquinone biosynthesis C-methylase UbiE